MAYALSVIGALSCRLIEQRYVLANPFACAERAAAPLSMDPGCSRSTNGR